ncbi:hypothetical protein [Kitasatospora sp. NPDC059571]|uniref:hypothetical protein n=1 Tax=Kitasatospora sp. NPDC059571 TaxID=3346871 RepID=UPI0036B7FC39
MAEALHGLSYDPLAGRLFAGRSPAELADLADWVSTRDPYGELPRLRAALHRVDPADDDLRGHVAHQLRCAWRQAGWTAGTARPLPAAVASGGQWPAETRGRPTVLVAPMTVAAPDALHTLAGVFGDRPLVAFGEEPTPRYGSSVPVVGGDVGSIRRILAGLAAGGVLCTYADFVYSGRDAEPATLFGRARPLSSGFVAVAARPGTMLLPTVMTYTPDGRIAMDFDEPLLVEGLPGDARQARAAMRDLITGLLEDLIRRNPQQWLLLPTLAFDSPQLARI